jgi:hypothetical protein
LLSHSPRFFAPAFDQTWQYPRTFLVTDGHDVYEVEGNASISALRKPGQAVLHFVSLDEIVHEVQRNAIAALKAA